MNKIKQALTPRLSNEGVTLVELLISIAVGSVVLIMLMQMITLNITVQRRTQYETQLLDQTYFISEKIRDYAFDLQPQVIELTVDNATQTVIEIRHEYDIESDAQGVLVQVPNLKTDYLIYDKTNERLTYTPDGGTAILLHNANVKIELVSTAVPPLSDSSIDAVPFPTTEGGTITLTLNVTFEFDSGVRGNQLQYITTIII